MKKPTPKISKKAPTKVEPTLTSIELETRSMDIEVAASLGIKKKEFLDEAVERSGVKKKYAKPAIEAALALLSEALIDEKKVNIPPLGKLKVNRKKDLPNAKVLKLSLRIPDQMGVPKPDGLSEESSDSVTTSKTPK